MYMIKDQDDNLIPAENTVFRIAAVASTTGVSTSATFNRVTHFSYLDGPTFAAPVAVATANLGNVQLGYLGKSGRFVAITN